MMKMLLVYIVEMIVCSGALYMFYRLLLDRRVPLGFCRVYLVASVVAATVIPALRIPIYPADVVYYAVPEEPVAASSQTEAMLADAAGAGTAAMPVAGEANDIFTQTALDGATELVPLVIEWIYGAVTALALAMLLMQLWKIYGYRRGARIERKPDYTLVENRRIPGPFSFFRGIYVPDRYTSQELSQVISHESSHIRRRHSVDLMVMEVMRAVTWFNPFVWIMRRALVEVHEFQADRDVLDAGVDLAEYRMLIFRQLFGCNPDVTNGLNCTQIKKRFLMMTKQTRSRFVLLKTAAAVPVLGGLLMLFSFTRQETVYVDVTADSYPVQTVTGQPEMVPDLMKPETSRTTVTGTVTDEQGDPVFNAIIRVKGAEGGVLSDYDGKYSILIEPGSVLVFEAEGMVSVEREVSGKVMNVKLMAKKASEQKAPEAPGSKSTYGETFGGSFSTSYSVPGTKTVKAEPQAGKGEKNQLVVTAYAKKIEETQSALKGRIAASTEYVALRNAIAGASPAADKGPKAFYVVDGEVKDNINDIEPNRILNISVVKGDEAVRAYGEKAADGVIVVRTKPRPLPAATQRAWRQIVANSAVCVVDGTKIMNAADVNIDDILTITEMTDRKLVKSFGERGKNGVYAVTTKKRLGALSFGSLWPNEDTYYVQNGKRIQHDEMINDVTRVNINYVNEEDALKKYGSEATNGAVEITSLSRRTLYGGTNWRGAAQPKFEGKDIGAFRKWVQGQIRTEPDPSGLPTSYNVQFSFIVGADGYVTDVCNTTKPGAAPDVLVKEVMRIVRRSPQWKPGKVNGKPVDFKYSMMVSPSM